MYPAFSESRSGNDTPSPPPSLLISYLRTDRSVSDKQTSNQSRSGLLCQNLDRKSLFYVDPSTPLTVQFSLNNVCAFAPPLGLELSATLTLTLICSVPPSYFLPAVRLFKVGKVGKVGRRTIGGKFNFQHYISGGFLADFD